MLASAPSLGVCFRSFVARPENDSRKARTPFEISGFFATYDSLPFHFSYLRVVLSQLFKVRFIYSISSTIPNMGNAYLLFN